jgi:hypothetical protein
MGSRSNQDTERIPCTTRETSRSIPRGVVTLVVALAIACGSGGGGSSGDEENWSDPWTDPVALNTNATSDSGDDFWPQVTTDGKGSWVAVWDSQDSLGGTIGGDSDILVARSTDEGASWTAPAALNSNATSDSGDDFWPQVTTDGGGSWVAVWDSWDSLGGTIGFDDDILVVRSTDDGATWTAPASLNSNAASDSGWDFSPQVTTDGAGSWVAVWTSADSLGGTIGGDADILVARSTDDGTSWTAPAALNTNATSDSGGDFSPQVATDGGGSWVAVWFSEDSLGGTISIDADILVARSTDAGATWSAPAALNTNATSDSGGDFSPQVTTDGAGSWVAVWSSGASPRPPRSTPTRRAIREMTSNRRSPPRARKAGRRCGPLRTRSAERSAQMATF